MGAEEEGKPSKPSEAPTSTQESPAMLSYPAWSSQMQAYYGPGVSSPHFYAPVVQSQQAPPFTWSQPHLIAPFGTSVPYPAAYPAAGIYAHPNMTLTPNTPPNDVGAEGKTPNAKDRSSTKKSKESNGEAGESAKATSGSGNEGASQSAESGSDGSLDASDENTDQDFAGNKKGSFEKMLADGANARNNAVSNISSVPGDPMVAVPATNLNISMDIWGTSPAGSALKPRPNSGVSSGVDATNERELKREKRKQSNRESARRSRLRKQQECEELQKRVDLLGEENNTLRQELQRLSDECQSLTDENKSIKEELTRICGPEAIAKLQDKNCGEDLAGEGDS